MINYQINLNICDAVLASYIEATYFRALECTNCNVIWQLLILCLLWLYTVTSDMKLKPSVGSDKAWVWTTAADFADEVAKPENLAIRFKDATSKYHQGFSSYLIINLTRLGYLLPI